jgi:DNA repair protein RecO (recombination protein O)
MPRKQTEAIILRTFPIGDQDKMVVFFTRHHGLGKGVAKGARKFSNRFGSSLEPLSYIKIFFYEKEGKELVTISNCDLLESFFDLQKDLDLSFTLSYFAELIENSLPARTEDDILFRLLLLSLQALKTGGDRAYLTAYFETWFLKINGFLPDFQSCKKCRKTLHSHGWLSPNKDGVYCQHCTSQKKEEILPEFKAFLIWVKKHSPSQSQSLPFSTDKIQSIHKILKEIIIFHMEHIPKALAYLK